jgi:EAL domain-containing protein (putative c-di-GMP-specific phosphodiesterase class I)
MFDAKEKGRGRFRFYSPELGAAVAARLSLERDLRAAQDNGEFELYYQPKIDARSGHVAGAEALLRWHRGEQGIVSPAMFIPLAEQLGLIVRIGDWVINEACRQLHTWQALGLPDMKLAVNLSMAQLNDAELATRVAGEIQRYDIRAEQLELEITESMMMSDPEQAIANLQALRALGVTLSIDDFGTGYSSMAYLKRLPVSALKLDRSFIQNIDQDIADADLCAGVIALAHMLGLQVVAEGVETVAQRDALLARDCDFFQGYLFARPLPVAEVTAYLQQAG